MALKFGDFARGFTGSLRAGYKRTRDLNERIVEYGTKRAIERGTKFYDARKEEDKKFIERAQFLADRNIGGNVAQRAILVRQSDDSWDKMTANLTEYTDRATLESPWDPHTYTKSLFKTMDPMTAEEWAAVDISAESVLQKITGQAPLINALTSQDQAQVADSFREYGTSLKDRATRAGLIGGSSAWYAERAISQAAGMMPEYKTPEALRQALAQEGRRGPFDPEGEVFTPAGSPEQQLRDRVAEAQILASEAGMKIDTHRLEHMQRTLAGTKFAEDFKPGGYLCNRGFCLSPEKANTLTHAQYLQYYAITKQREEINEFGQGHVALDATQWLRFGKESQLDTAVAMFSDGNQAIGGGAALTTVDNRGLRFELLGVIEALLGELYLPLNRTARDDRGLSVEAVNNMSLVGRSARAKFGSFVVMDYLISHPKGLQNSNRQAVETTALYNAAGRGKDAVAEVKAILMAARKEGDTTDYANMTVRLNEDGSFHADTDDDFLKAAPAGLQAGNVKFDISTREAALVSLALFNRVKTATDSTGIDTMFNAVNSGLNLSVPAITEMTNFLGAIRDNPGMELLTVRDAVQFFQNPNWAEVYDSGNPYASIFEYGKELAAGATSTAAPVSAATAPVSAATAAADAAYLSVMRRKENDPEYIVDTTARMIAAEAAADATRTADPVVADPVVAAPAEVIAPAATDARNGLGATTADFSRLPSPQAAQLNLVTSPSDVINDSESSHSLAAAASRAIRQVPVGTTTVSDMLGTLAEQGFYPIRSEDGKNIVQSEMLLDPEWVDGPLREMLTPIINITDFNSEIELKTRTGLGAPRISSTAHFSHVSNAVPDTEENMPENYIEFPTVEVYAPAGTTVEDLNAASYGEAITEISPTETSAVTEQILKNVVGNLRAKLADTFTIRDEKLVYARTGSMITTNANGDEVTLSYTQGDVVGTHVVGEWPTPLPIVDALENLGRLTGDGAQYRYISSDGTINLEELANWLSD